MKITCPKCGHTAEVDESVIPTGFGIGSLQCMWGEISFGKRIGAFR